MRPSGPIQRDFPGGRLRHILMPVDFDITPPLVRGQQPAQTRVKSTAARMEHLVARTLAPAAATRVDPHTSERGSGSDPRQAENGSREATLLPVPRPLPQGRAQTNGKNSEGRGGVHGGVSSTFPQIPIPESFGHPPSPLPLSAGARVRGKTPTSGVSERPPHPRVRSDRLSPGGRGRRAPAFSLPRRNVPPVRRTPSGVADAGPTRVRGNVSRGASPWQPPQP
jgi:hypothetical protein